MTPVTHTDRLAGRTSTTDHDAATWSTRGWLA
jgi:hypothetical protein